MLLEIVGGPTAFKVRAAAVIVRDGRVLLNAIKGSGQWMLPGGTGEFGETAEATLVRELREELGEGARVGRLLWMVEHFFELRGRPWHQLTWIYEASLGDGHAALARDAWDQDGTDTRDEFRWFALADLGGVRLVPGFLADALRELPREPRHVGAVEPRR